jgi:hypothetical protein
MNSTSLKTSLGIALLVVAGSALAGENTVLLTQHHGKGSNVVSVDLQSGGDVAAFQYLITLPPDAKAINLSNCLGELPKTHTGLCQSKDNKVAVVFYSTNNTALPAGITGVGTISYKSSAVGKNLVTVDKMVGSSASGQTNAVKAQVEQLETNEK